MKYLDKLEEIIIISLMAAGTLVIFLAVVHRYASGLPIPYVQDVLIQINTSWAQELCIYMFVWMAKFGAAYGVRTGIHVGVDVVLNHLQTPRRNALIVFGLLSGACFTAVVASLGASLVWKLAFTEQTSPDLEIPIWLVYLAIPVGSTLMSMRFLQVAWQFGRTGVLPKHDHSHVEGLEEKA